MSDTKAIKTSRRTFLLAAGAGGAATVAAIAAKLAPQRVSEVRDPNDKDKNPVRAIRKPPIFVITTAQQKSDRG